MIVLVSNIGSTSFKFRLFDMTDERELARGGVERIGMDDAIVKVGEQNWTGRIADHGEAIDHCLKLLPDPNIKLDAIGFKAVHGGGISGAVKIDDRVLQTMTDFFDIAPAHNPPYVAAMKAFMAKLPDVPQVAA